MPRMTLKWSLPNMASETKTFRVACAECGKPFFVRFEVVDAAAEGKGEETVTCMFCKKDVKIPLERKYMKTDELVRSRRLGE